MREHVNGIEKIYGKDIITDEKGKSLALLQEKDTKNLTSSTIYKLHSF